jgi:hypothetical protein
VDPRDGLDDMEKYLTGKLDQQWREEMKQLSKQMLLAKKNKKCMRYF